MKYKNIEEVYDLRNTVISESHIDVVSHEFMKFALKVREKMVLSDMNHEYALLNVNIHKNSRCTLSIVMRDTGDYSLFTMKRPTSLIRCEDLKGEELNSFCRSISRDIVKLFLGLFNEFDPREDLSFILDFGTLEMISGTIEDVKKRRNTERQF